ncbi:MAG: XkdX family protein [Synergistaceae bacterium]|nr:XkdX family protein [Synergistaceae bacterium]
MRKFAEMVSRYYDAGIWSKERVKDSVMRGKLSPEEYREITGEEYE